MGHLLLVEEIAKYYGPKLGREIDPLSEICVTQGANGSLSPIIQAMANPGDEVVYFEPTFPMYLDHMQLAGVKEKSVPLHVNKDGDWVFNPDELRAAFSNKTKLLILNSPHNPTGKCFTREELELISDVLDEYPDCFVLSDEVYDFLTFDNLKHIPFSTIRDNWLRTITVYSGGKLLNATGWKVGWMIGPQKLVYLASILSNTTYYC